VSTVISNISSEQIKPDWRQRVSARDRQTSDAVAQWLRPVPWEWFVTLTAPWNLRPETADKKLQQWRNSLEKLSRTNVCFAAARESKSTSYGIRVPCHFHVLLVSQMLLSKETIEFCWLNLISPSLAVRAQAGMRQESVCVERFDMYKRGPEYCFKFINECDGEWFSHRLERFLPNVSGTSRPNHRSVRSHRRDSMRAARTS